MNDLTGFDGVNLYLGSDEQLKAIPSNLRANSFLAKKNQQGKIIGCSYYNPLGKEVVLSPTTLEQLNTTIFQNSFQALAIQKAMDLTLPFCQPMYVTPYELEQELPELWNTNVLKTGKEWAKEYFLTKPESPKFNRKISGLQHSYAIDSQKQLIEFKEKLECRVVWTTHIPTQDIFYNLPDNTNAAYVLVQSTSENTSTLYYIEKSDSHYKPKLISNHPNIDFFKAFEVSNKGLTKEELSTLDEEFKHKHKSDRSNIYGEGGFARVKKSQLETEDGPPIAYATKVQILDKEEKIATKMGGGRGEQVKNQSREASILHDMMLGDNKVGISLNKAYIHMLALGESLPNRLKQASSDEKLDLAIKLLIKVDNLHTGKEAISGTPYAHRDLKPDNVVIDRNNHLHLVDFGLATPEIQNKTEKLGGTLPYAALDQEIIDGYLKKHPNQKQKPTTEDLNNSPITNNDDDSDYDVLELSELSSMSAEEDEDLLQSDAASKSIRIERFDKESDWVFQKTLTKNYLEDDKVAALRTVYCNPASGNPRKIYSIFNKTEFEQLPLPIQEILDTTKIASLLSEDRRQDTERLFAAVLITYQQDRNLSESQCITMIADLRLHPEKQGALIQHYQQPRNERSEDASMELSLEEKPKTKNTFLRSFMTFLKDETIDPTIKEKPMPKSSFLKSFKDLVSSGRRSSSVSPTTSDNTDSDSSSSELLENVPKIKPVGQKK